MQLTKEQVQSLINSHLKATISICIHIVGGNSKHLSYNLGSCVFTITRNTNKDNREEVDTWRFEDVETCIEFFNDLKL